MRIFSPQDPEHCETTALLPWFLNGTLDDLEHGRVERHVFECVVCRREAERELAVRDAVFAVAPDAPWRPSLARVESRIDAVEKRGRAHPGGRTFRESWRSMAPWAQVAIAAQVLLVCLLAAGWYRASDQPAYRTLGAAPSAVTGDTIIVIFEPAATERDIRQLLLVERARLAAGPSPDGAYTLEVKGSEADVVLARLKQSLIVRFAERGASAGMPR